MKGTELLLFAALILVAPYATPRQAGGWAVVMLIGAFFAWWLE